MPAAAKAKSALSLFCSVAPKDAIRFFLLFDDFQLPRLMSGDIPSHASLAIGNREYTNLGVFFRNGLRALVESLAASAS